MTTTFTPSSATYARISDEVTRNHLPWTWFLIDHMASGWPTRIVSKELLRETIETFNVVPVDMLFDQQIQLLEEQDKCMMAPLSQRAGERAYALLVGWQCPPTECVIVDEGDTYDVYRPRDGRFRQARVRIRELEPPTSPSSRKLIDWELIGGTRTYVTNLATGEIMPTEVRMAFVRAAGSTERAHQWCNELELDDDEIRA
jgi:hypothetical protein